MYTRKVLIFDMDGCLCHNDFPPNFNIKDISVQEARQICQHSVPYQKAVQILGILYLSFKIIILTGREDFLRRVTVDWLKKHKFAYHKLITMKHGWTVFDEYVNYKIENIKRIRPILVVDDFQPVLDTVNNMGISTYRIEVEEDWNLNKILGKVL